MKLIIIEGPDNTGKNTIVHNILEYCNYVKVKHCSKPVFTTPDETSNAQKELFGAIVLDDIFEHKYSNQIDIIVHNRSYYGEYVYGCLYRQNTDNFVKDMIKHLECVYKTYISENDVYYITLLAKNPEVIVKNDDGKSISEGKLEKIIEEQNRFKEIHDFSSFKNKHIIYIDENGEFKSRDEIWNEFKNFVKL